MKNKFNCCLTVLFTLISSSLVLAQTDNIDQKVVQERTNQVARQIGENVVRRLSGEVSDDIRRVQENTLAASADDVSSLLPDSTWLNTSWSEISDDALGIDVDADIYLSTLGFDKQLGDWFLGISASYAYTETEIGGLGTQSDTHTVVVTPYLAYVINKNFFISVLTAYNYTRNEPETIVNNLDSSTDQNTTELNFNGLKVYNDWIFLGKTGLRYTHTVQTFDQSSNTPNDNDKDNWAYFVDMQLGYNFDQFVKGLRINAGALYEYIETEDGEDDGVLYMNTSIDYLINNTFSCGLKYSHDVNNEDFDINTVTLNLRLAL